MARRICIIVEIPQLVEWALLRARRLLMSFMTVFVLLFLETLKQSVGFIHS